LRGADFTDPYVRIADAVGGPLAARNLGGQKRETLCSNPIFSNKSAC